MESRSGALGWTGVGVWVSVCSSYPRKSPVFRIVEVETTETCHVCKLFTDNLFMY